MKPLLLDLFCCQGGASAGYAAAGFRIAGVDLYAQPRYPYPFVRYDALAFLQALLDLGTTGLGRYAAIHASPPCQAHTNAQRIQGREHPDLIAPVRELLDQTGLPYIIENVVGAPLKSPVMLCGATLGLHTYRHRLFESNVTLTVPEHQPHDQQQIKMGRPLEDGDFYQAVGHFSNVPYVKTDLGVPWMSREGIKECIPPAYTKYLGRQLLEAI